MLISYPFIQLVEWLFWPFTCLWRHLWNEEGDMLKVGNEEVVGVFLVPR